LASTPLLMLFGLRDQLSNERRRFGCRRGRADFLSGRNGRVRPLSHIGERRGDVAGVCLHALRRALRLRRQLHMLRCACRGFLHAITRAGTFHLDARIERIDHVAGVQLQRVEVVRRLLHISGMGRRNLGIGYRRRQESLRGRRVLPLRHDVSDVGMRRVCGGRRSGSGRGRLCKE
jgi:hypothetical protein